MTERQPQALASAYRRAVGKFRKIKELEITSEMPTDAQDRLVETLARNKGTAEGKDWTGYVKGQRWYVEDLVKFAGMETHEALDHEYALAFPDIASEQEMLDAIEALR